ncbi:hypothetical protein TNCV_3633281, partial [Trichonephila clavipes]
MPIEGRSQAFRNHIQPQPVGK